MNDAHPAPAGWYIDPNNKSQERYWDGLEWTNDYRPLVPTLSANVNPTYANAKAQARAAKAYAKAQRPWYRKKRWYALGFVALLFVIIVSSTAGGGNDGTTATDPAAASSPSAKAVKEAPKPKKQMAGVGQTVSLEGTRYTVTKVSQTDNIGGAYGQKADGVFVVVSMTIENTKDETKTFMDNAATFIAKDGTKYSGSDAAMYLGDDSLFLREMQPDLKTKGQLVFDVPPAKVKGGVLKVEDLFGRGDTKINLGL